MANALLAGLSWVLALGGLGCGLRYLQLVMRPVSDFYAHGYLTHPLGRSTQQTTALRSCLVCLFLWLFLRLGLGYYFTDSL